MFPARVHKLSVVYANRNASWFDLSSLFSLKGGLQKKNRSHYGLSWYRLYFGTSVWDLMIGAGVIKMNVFTTQYGLIAMIFFQGQVVAALFAHAFRLAEAMSRDLQKRVEEKTRDISSLMNHVPLGICTISGDAVVDPVHSRYLLKMFDIKNASGEKPIKLFFEKATLTGDQKQLLDATIENIVGNDSLNFEGQC